MKYCGIKYFIFIILTFLILFIVLYYLKKMPYEKNYFQKIGVNEIGYSYEDAISELGEPLRQNYEYFDLEEEEGSFQIGLLKAEYEDYILDFILTEKHKPNRLLSITYITDKYKFGRKKIGVGSTKSQVLGAYKNVRKSPDGEFKYIDNGIWVEFKFDGDIVKEVYVIEYMSMF